MKIPTSPLSAVYRTIVAPSVPSSVACILSNSRKYSTYIPPPNFGGSRGILNPKRHNGTSSLLSSIINPPGSAIHQRNSNYSLNSSLSSPTFSTLAEAKAQFYTGSPSTSSVDSSKNPNNRPRRPGNCISRSRFKEKKGQIHGTPYPQRKGILSPTRTVPTHIIRPPYAVLGGTVPSTYPEPQIHNNVSIKAMRKASAIASDVLARAGELVKEGITTDQIDEFVHNYTISKGAYPSPLTYATFPKSVCTSVNEVVCHGIPDDTVLFAGDVVKLDVSCYIDGVHGDTCRTFVVGGMDREKNNALDQVGFDLVRTTKYALNEAIQICGPGVPIHQVGSTIETILDKERFEGVSVFAGHGVGSTFHTEPIVYHQRNKSSYIMKPGMTFTIEPMVVEGSAKVSMWPDNWTIVTNDGGRAAQFEHTLLITDHGVEVLTQYE